MSTKTQTRQSKKANTTVATPKAIKHNKHFPLVKSTRSAMTKMIKESNGRFFTCTHVDKEGNLRTMNAVKSNREIETPATDLGYITVYSTQDKGFRNINPQTITDLSINRTHYVTKMPK